MESPADLLACSFFFYEIIRKPTGSCRSELPSLLNRRLQDNRYINVQTVKYGLAPGIVNELFKRKSTSYSLRNSDFDIPTFNTINCGKHSLRYQCKDLIYDRN